MPLPVEVPLVLPPAPVPELLPKSLVPDDTPLSWLGVPGHH
jgi:hypothetical protein